jgi:ribosomal protein L37E
MRLLRRFHRGHAPEEIKCPRCRTPAPVDAVACAVCGWDIRDAYKRPVEAREGEWSAAPDNRER